MANKVWVKCVKDARLILTKKEDPKRAICELATRACRSCRWGHQFFDTSTPVTVTKFAKDIGIEPKVLLEWLESAKEEG